MTGIRASDITIALALLLVAVAYAVATGGVDQISSGFALAAVVQSAYTDTMEPAVAGMQGNMVPWSCDTRICETSAGIGFGLACAQGTADKGAVLGGTTATFVGVSVKDITLVNAVGDEYQQYNNMSVQTRGDIWVVTTVSTSPTDDVHFDATTGTFKISGGQAVTGARWMKTRAAGLGLLRLSGHLPVA